MLHSATRVDSHPASVGRPAAPTLWPALPSTVTHATPPVPLHRPAVSTLQHASPDGADNAAPTCGDCSLRRS
jgi:hypothetical protein